MQRQSSYKVHLNMIFNGELSDPLCDSVNRGLTLVRLGNTHVHTWRHMDEVWISRQPGLTDESDHKVLVSLRHTDSSCNMYQLVTKLYILIIYQGEHSDSVILPYLLCIHFWQDCHWSSFPPLTDSLCCAAGQAVRDRKNC